MTPANMLRSIARKCSIYVAAMLPQGLDLREAELYDVSDRPGHFESNGEDFRKRNKGGIREKERKGLPRESSASEEHEEHMLLPLVSSMIEKILHLILGRSMEGLLSPLAGLPSCCVGELVFTDEDVRYSSYRIFRHRGGVLTSLQGGAVQACPSSISSSPAVVLLPDELHLFLPIPHLRVPDSGPHSLALAQSRFYQPGPCKSSATASPTDAVLSAHPPLQLGLAASAIAAASPSRPSPKPVLLRTAVSITTRVPGVCLAVMRQYLLSAAWHQRRRHHLPSVAAPSLVEPSKIVLKGV
ncbi:hypothetical protein C8R44DRAFT_851705 [Mycena epipterygia]|nr:hypothetical protein C8R44DRAFT_851705 [Mycena epipterygia]